MTQRRRSKFAIVPDDVLYHPALSGTDVRVYAVLARFADQKTRACYPSHRTVADKIGVDPTTVKRAIRELVAAGVIEVQQRRRTSNVYRVLDLEGAPTPSEAQQQESAATPPKKVILAPSEGASTPSEVEVLSKNHLPKEEPERCAPSGPASQAPQSHSEPRWKEDTSQVQTGGTDAGRPREGHELDPIFYALAVIWGARPEKLTRPAKRRIGLAVKEIREVDPDVTPEEIRRRASAYQRLHPDWELTPMSLSKYWASLESGYKFSRGGPLDRPVRASAVTQKQTSAS